MSKKARDRKKRIRLSKHFMPDKGANPINPPWIVDKQGCKILREQLFKLDLGGLNHIK